MTTIRLFDTVEVEGHGRGLVLGYTSGRCYAGEILEPDRFGVRFEGDSFERWIDPDQCVLVARGSIPPARSTT